jgi:hypothetical protein
MFGFSSNNRLVWRIRNSSSSDLTRKETSRLFRDCHGWYHVVLQRDSTLTTAADRQKIWVNGEQITDWNQDNNDNEDLTYSSDFLTDLHIGRGNVNASTNYYADGYLAEVYYIDGQALPASNFGETDPVTGQWLPKKYAGTYGTNGAYLNFKDNSGATATTIGKDSSGNSNNFTPNNFVAADSVIDTPTNNFCYLPKLQGPTGSTLSEAGLYVALGSTHKSVFGNFSIVKGKWYWEARATGGSLVKWVIGVTDFRNSTVKQVSGTNYLPGNSANSYSEGDAVSLYIDDIKKNGSTHASDVCTDIADGDKVSIAFDADAGKIWFALNGTWINGSGTASTTLDPSNHDVTVTAAGSNRFPRYVPAIAGENVNWWVNFGQGSAFGGAETAQGNKDSAGKGDFFYAVPSGFKALCTNNLPEPTFKKGGDSFKVKTYTGNGSDGHAITGVGFQPDLVWIANRIDDTYKPWYDSVRGATKMLRTNTDDLEGTFSTVLQSFDADGFTVGTDTAHNANGKAIVSYNWKKSVSAGLDIVTYTGDGNSPRNVAHSLGVVPEMVIIKRLNDDEDWIVGFGPVLPGSKDGHYIKLNTNADEGTGAGPFNSTNPTSTNIVLGSDVSTNGNGSTYVAYCFASVEGYSQFGYYKGNGLTDSGTMVVTNFRPAFVLVKKFDGGTGNWQIRDSGRDPDNPTVLFLCPNTDDDEGTSSHELDFYCNGFKNKGSGGAFNTNGHEYVYAAFAESPFKYSNAN